MNGEAFWKTVGKTPETLSVLITDLGIEPIGFVKKYCRKLKLLYLSGSEGTVNAGIAECIACYSDQLEHAHLHFLSETQITQVKNACSNSRFDLYVHQDGLGAAINMPADKLEVIEVGGKYESGRANDSPID